MISCMNGKEWVNYQNEITVECKSFKIDCDYCYDDRPCMRSDLSWISGWAGSDGITYCRAFDSSGYVVFRVRGITLHSQCKKVYAANGSFCRNFPFCILFCVRNKPNSIQHRDF